MQLRHVRLQVALAPRPAARRGDRPRRHALLRRADAAPAALRAHARARQGGSRAARGRLPARCARGAIPSGIVAARLGVKPTVLVGLTVVAVTTALFGLAGSAWQLDLARFARGSRAPSRGRARSPGSSPPPRRRRGALIGQAFAAAVAGALLGPVLGGVASVAGTGRTFGAVAVASLGLAVWAAPTPAARPVSRSRCARSSTRPRPRVLLSVWFVVLPRCSSGRSRCSGRCGCRRSGSARSAIGAMWLLDGRARDRQQRRRRPRRPTARPARADAGRARRHGRRALVLPWPDNRFVLAASIVFAGVAFGTFYTPGMTLLTHAAEDRGLDYGYAFALMNLAWAPGRAAAARRRGARGGDVGRGAVPRPRRVALLTLAGLWRSRSSS